MLLSRRSSLKTAGCISCASSINSTGRSKDPSTWEIQRSRKSLETAPSILGFEFNAKQVAHFAIKVGQVAGGMGHGANGDLAHPPQSFGQNDGGRRFCRYRGRRRSMRSRPHASRCSRFANRNALFSHANIKCLQRAVPVKRDCISGHTGPAVLVCIKKPLNHCHVWADRPVDDR